MHRITIFFQISYVTEFKNRLILVLVFPTRKSAEKLMRPFVPMGPGTVLNGAGTGFNCVREFDPLFMTSHEMPLIRVGCGGGITQQPFWPVLESASCGPTRLVQHQHTCPKQVGHRGVNVNIYPTRPLGDRWFKSSFNQITPIHTLSPGLRSGPFGSVAG